MIYGWNFNNTPIPQDVRKRFRDTRVVDKKRGTLQGVCNEPSEQEAMAIVAHNGSRKWFWHTEVLGSKTWYGLYVYLQLISEGVMNKHLETAIRELLRDYHVKADAGFVEALHQAIAKLGGNDPAR